MQFTWDFLASEDWRIKKMGSVVTLEFKMGAVAFG